MKRVPIPPSDLLLKPVGLWLNRWLLLTAGDLACHNMMTVGWGSIGCMWGMPFAQVVVRPQRCTKQFLDSHPTFTLCSFPEEYKSELKILGATSGRGGGKLSRTKLTLQAAKIVEAPVYAEADLVLECRKIYWQDMDPENFSSPEIMSQYQQKDFHRIYFGEIVHAEGNTTS